VPIEELIRYRVPADRAGALEAAYGRAAVALDASPHCLDYALHRCVEEPERYVLRITWTSTEDHLEGFRKGPHFPAFLAEVRPFIEHIEEMQHYEATPVAARRSIYDAVGGVRVFFRIAGDMHAAMKADELLGPLFASSPPSHVPHLAMWLCEVFGGPPLWTDTLGDIGRMLAKHAQLDLGEAQRVRFRDLATAAARAHVSDERAVAAMGEYFDWGTKVAVDNSKPDHVPDAAAGVPHWDWPADAQQP